MNPSQSLGPKVEDPEGLDPEVIKRITGNDKIYARDLNPSVGSGLLKQNRQKVVSIEDTDEMKPIDPEVLKRIVGDDEIYAQEMNPISFSPVQIGNET